MKFKRDNIDYFSLSFTLPLNNHDDLQKYLSNLLYLNVTDWFLYRVDGKCVGVAHKFAQ